MRKIIGSLFQSLDGVIQAPGGPEEDQTGFAHGGWVFPYFDDSLDEPMGRLLGGSYELLLGRRTYEIFAAYWPHNGDQPIGETFNAVRKHVVTSSDRPLTWNNSQRLVGDPAEAVARLKASDGPDLLIQGSSMLYQARFPHASSISWRCSPSRSCLGAASAGIRAIRRQPVHGRCSSRRTRQRASTSHRLRVVKRFAPAALPQNPRAKTNSRSVSVKQRGFGEPATLRPSV